jgi:hypothetical protein
MQASHHRRWIVLGIVAALSFGLIGGANGAPGRGAVPNLTVFFGPARAFTGQEVSIAVTNASPAAGNAVVAVFDGDGASLLQQSKQVGPGRSAMFNLPEVDDEVLLWARVTTPGPGSKWPASLRVTDAGGANPLITEIGFPASVVTSSPQLPIPGDAALRVLVTPLTKEPATFTVRFIGAGGVQMGQATMPSVDPKHIAFAAFQPPTAATNLRAAVKGPAGSRFLVSIEVLDAGQSVICKWEGPEFDAAKNE